MNNKGVKFVAGFIAFCVVFMGGYILGTLERGGGKSLEGYSKEFLETSQEMRELLEDNFYFQSAYDQSKLEDGMLHGLPALLGDPYTYYYNAEELAAYREGDSGQYVGIGVLMSVSENGYPMASQVYDNSPAKTAGILEGDIFLEVDGVPFEPFSNLSANTARLRGTAGTTVAVAVLRGDQRLEFTMKRASVVQQFVKRRMLNATVGYLSLSEFSHNCDKEVKDAITWLQGQGMKKLVLDLRNNPGGYVDPATKIADLFLDRGLILSTVYANGDKEETRSDKEKLDLPLVVLVNGYSASASEIVTGALKDREAAIIVGTQTYGKGIVQLLYPLTEGGAINITIAGYQTPNGVNIHGIGITPHHVVELPENVRSGEKRLTDSNDTQLQKALELLQ